MKNKSKKTKAIIITAVLLCGVLIAGGLFMFFNRDTDKVEKYSNITDVEILTLRFSGMRGSEEYEIVTKGDKAEIAYYQIKYNDGEQRELQQSAECDAQEVVDILNKCEAGKWNGFSGKHPRGVLDGRMFSLEAKVNGGKKLSASGSENFPKNFRTFEDWLREKLYGKQ